MHLRVLVCWYVRVLANVFVSVYGCVRACSDFL